MTTRWRFRRRWRRIVLHLPPTTADQFIFLPGSTKSRSIKRSMRRAYPSILRAPECIFWAETAGFTMGRRLLSHRALSIMAHCGPRPNNNPLFATYYPNGNVTFQNLVIVGCNQAVAVTSQVVRFWNTYLTGGSGGKNSAALYLQDTFWVYFDYGGLQSGLGVPTLLMAGVACSGCYAGVGDVYMSNTLLAGGPIQYQQQGAANGPGSGNMVFRNISQESGNTDFLQINSNGYTFYGFGPIEMDSVQQPDNTNKTAALINYNAAGSNLSGVFINNSSSASNSIAVKITAGSIDHYFITGCADACSTTVVNALGRPMGSGMSETGGGFDFVTDTSFANVSRLINQPFGSSLSGNPNRSGPAMRVTPSGSLYSTMGIDAGQGLMFGLSTQPGWNTTLSQVTAPNADMSFVTAAPPSNVSATVSNTGGTVGAGTYNLWVVATTANNCNNISNFSAPSSIFPNVVISGGTTNAFKVVWTASPSWGTKAIYGYCVLVNNGGPFYNSSSNASNVVVGASTSSATIGVFPNVVSGGYYAPVPVWQDQHTFTPFGMHVAGGINVYTAGGSANAYTLTTTPTASTLYTSLPVGFEFTAVIPTGNTGASTFTINGLRALNIIKGGGAALSGGEMFAHKPYTFLYDGADIKLEFPETAGGIGGVGPLNNAVAVKTASYSLADTDGTIICKSGAIMRLPASPITTTRQYIIKNMDAAKTCSVTTAAKGGIDGKASVMLPPLGSGRSSSITIQFDSADSEWILE